MNIIEKMKKIFKKQDENDDWIVRGMMAEVSKNLYCGEINWNGKVIFLLENAVMYGDQAMAKGIDNDGKFYWVHWEVLDGFVPKDDYDFSEACDWENPTNVVEIEDFNSEEYKKYTGACCIDARKLHS